MKIYQIDAFTDRVFSGNPAAVCPLDHWLDDAQLQRIAAENNQPATAFYVKRGEGYDIRWFTPAIEANLCGHATLAAAHVLFHHEHHSDDTIRFYTRFSGELSVSRSERGIALNFPADRPNEMAWSDELQACFDQAPEAVYKGKTDYLLIFANEQQIRNIRPDFEKIAGLDARGVIVSAKGTDTDFVSRFFAPRSGVLEDPVTGSAHTTLVPYWATVLGRNELCAAQLSARGGRIIGRYAGNRVELIGQARLYFIGEINTL